MFLPNSSVHLISAGTKCTTSLLQLPFTVHLLQLLYLHVSFSQYTPAILSPKPHSCLAFSEYNLVPISTITLISNTLPYVFRWWVCYHSMCIFCCFQWLKIFTQSLEAIYDLDIVLGYVLSLWKSTHCHFDHVWPFLTICYHLQCFYLIFNLCLLISDLLLHQWTICVFLIL
jgi:hypothetical protein